MYHRYKLQVPTTEWHCNGCKERITLRESKLSGQHNFEGAGCVDKQRSRIQEEDLLLAAVERRVISGVGAAGGKGGSSANASANLSAMEPLPGQVRA
jgi:hypothetical protein